MTDADELVLYREREAAWDETEALIQSRRPMTPDENARESKAVAAYYGSTATIGDFLVLAETELRYACHVTACNCSGTANRANMALLYIRDALKALRETGRATD